MCKGVPEFAWEKQAWGLELSLRLSVQSLRRSDRTQGIRRTNEGPSWGPFPSPAPNKGSWAGLSGGITLVWVPWLCPAQGTVQGRAGRNWPAEAYAAGDPASPTRSSRCPLL